MKYQNNLHKAFGVHQETEMETILNYKDACKPGDANKPKVPDYGGMYLDRRVYFAD